VNPIPYAILRLLLFFIDVGFTAYLFEVSPLPLREGNPLGFNIFSVVLIGISISLVIVLSYITHYMRQYGKWYKLFDVVMLVLISHTIYQGVSAIHHNWGVYTYLRNRYGI